MIIPKDTLYTAAVELVLNKAGFKNVSIIASDKKVTDNRDDWNIDTPIIDVVNDLLDEINYRSLEAGRDGILTSFENKEPSASDTKIHYKADSKSVILNDKEIENDDFRRYNRFVGHVFTPNMSAPMRFTYLNDNPASPTSPTNNGGYIITAVKEFQDVADQKTLEDNVHRWVSEVQQSYEQVTMRTGIAVQHEVKEILSVNSQGVNGIYVETAWSFDNFGAGGKMSHELRRAVYE